MDNREFGRLLEVRTKKFGVMIYKFSAAIPYTTESKVLKNQITKSGTSIGANYREANRSKSKADFTNKIKICEGEASETVYWLEIIKDLNLNKEKTINNLIKEANELLSIFTSISKKVRKKE